MTMTDPIADMLTRIRNASCAGLLVLDVPCSKEKLEIARIMKEKGFSLCWMFPVQRKSLKSRGL